MLDVDESPWAGNWTKTWIKEISITIKNKNNTNTNKVGGTKKISCSKQIPTARFGAYGDLPCNFQISPIKTRMQLLAALAGNWVPV